MALSIDREVLRQEGFEGILIKPLLPVTFLAEVRKRIGPPGGAEAGAAS
jgi:hypothetical protein